MELAIIALLIVFNGLFVMGEMAIVSSRRARLKGLADAGDEGAKTALALFDDPNRFLSTIQIGITLVGVLTSTFGGATLSESLANRVRAIPALEPYAQTIAIATVVIGISYFTLILGELVPKRLALSAPERISARLAGAMRMIALIATPIGWVLAQSTELVLKLFPGAKDKDNAVTDDEIKYLMKEGTETGHFQQGEKNIVEMALRLGDRSVSALMTPRTQVQMLGLRDSTDVITARVLESPHSRFPVFDRDENDVVGIVQVKDLLATLLQGNPIDLKAALMPALFVPESAPALKALELFKQSGSALAVIVDEYGDIEGMVTLNDLLEALVGDIATPGLDEGPPAVRREDGSWLIDGMVPIDEVIDLIGIQELPEDDGSYQTLGGFMMAMLKRIPAPADAVTVGDYRFEIMDMDGRRVDKVLVVPPPGLPDT